MSNTLSYRKGLYQPEEFRQRPREVDFVICDEIIDRIANGETLNQICQGNRDFPLPGTFLRWCEEDPSLAERHEAARRRGADVNFDEALEMAYHPDAQRARILSEALFKHVEKTAPEKYSPRSVNKNVDPDKDKGGYDASAELRRRVEEMAARNAVKSKASDAGQDQTGQ